MDEFHLFLMIRRQHVSADLHSRLTRESSAYFHRQPQRQQIRDFSPPPKDLV